MNQAEIESTLLEIFAVVLGHPVTPALKRAGETSWDSLKHIQLIFAVEEKFAVQFSEAEIPRMDSFEKFLEHLRRGHAA